MLLIFRRIRIVIGFDGVFSAYPAILPFDRQFTADLVLGFCFAVSIASFCVLWTLIARSASFRLCFHVLSGRFEIVWSVSLLKALLVHVS